MKTAFAKNLVNRRNLLGLNQDQAAAKLNVKRQTYAKWEESKSQPNIEMLINIADIFHINNLLDFIKNPK